MRSETDKVFVGVCGGIASYLGVDSVFVRLAFVLLALASGIGFLLYFVLLLVMPNEADFDAESSTIIQRNIDQFGSDFNSGVKRVRQHPQGPTIAAGLIIMLGVYLLLDSFHLLNWLNGTVVVALVFIGVGAYLIAKRNKN